MSTLPNPPQVASTRAVRYQQPSALSAHPSVVMATLDASQKRDLNLVSLAAGASLHKGLNSPGTNVVQLYTAATYYLMSDLTITQGVALRGMPGCVVRGYKGLLPCIIVDAGADSVVEFRGVTFAVPLVAKSRVRIIDCYFLGTQFPAWATLPVVEIQGANAAQSLVQGCESDATGDGTQGVWVHALAAGCRIVGNDFSSCVTPYYLGSLLGTHTGPDANHGVVTSYTE